MQRGTPENLWPKFILKGAPLRATSSDAIRCTSHTNSKRLKTKNPSCHHQVGFSTTLESFTRDQTFSSHLHLRCPFLPWFLWKTQL